jgi:sugar phosphate isomerase/epimerase
MRLGLCCPLDALPVAAAAGADYVEPPVAFAAVPEEPDAVWRANLARLRDAGLTAEAWNVLLPGDLKVTGPAADLPRLRRYLDVAAGRLAEAGAAVAVFGSGGSRTPPAGYPLDAALREYLDAAEMAAAAFAPHGITVCVEPLCAAETPVLNTVAQACAFVAERGLPNLRVTADLYHMGQAGEPPELGDLVRWIGHAHVADDGRQAPGTGDAPIAAFLAALKAGGYTGRVSIECSWRDFAAEAAPAVAFLRSVA